MLLLPAGVAIPLEMARDTAILKPVKRAELYAALGGLQSDAEVEPAAAGVRQHGDSGAWRCVVGR